MKSYPTPEELILIMASIEANVRLDDPPSMSYHQSQRGNPCVVTRGVSGGRSWTLQIYEGSWFWVSIEGFEPFTVDNLFSMITSMTGILGSR